MTGYGKSVTLFQDKKICVEIRSLNGKAMDLSTRIAPQFKCREMEIRTLLSTQLERGKVDFALWVEQGEKADTPAINQAVMQGYLEQMAEASICSIIVVIPNKFFVCAHSGRISILVQMYKFIAEHTIK